MSCLVQVVFACFFKQQRYVFLVKTAYYERGAVLHHFAEVAHVGNQNVAVDVGKHNVEHAAHVVQHRRVAVQHLYVFRHAIEFGVVACVIDAPLVNVVAHNVCRTEL